MRIYVTVLQAQHLLELLSQLMFREMLNLVRDDGFCLSVQRRSCWFDYSFGIQSNQVEKNRYFDLLSTDWFTENHSGKYRGKFVCSLSPGEIRDVNGYILFGPKFSLTSPRVLKEGWCRWLCLVLKI